MAERSFIRLADGRRLGYAATGPRDGIPVVYCHGAIGTPLGRAERVARELGVRHISVWRPGFGGSDPAPGRTILAFARDLRQLAETLGLGRFSVVGVSAGGPYALAAASQLHERIDRVALCSSLAPGTLRIQPPTQLPPRLVDRAGGLRGMIADYLLYAGEWGFAPSQVSCEVHLWHGLRDSVVPLDHALQLAVSLPRCRVFFDPDEGHHFFRRRLPEVLGVLVGRQTAPRVRVSG